VPATTCGTDLASTPRSRYERIELARRLYQRFHASCFWHCPEDLEITADDIPFVAKGLGTWGGRYGFMLARKLMSTDFEHEALECR
jgi:hypothetical protein